MDMEQMKLPREETRLTAVTHASTLTHESAEEFLLPDYMPAVRRIVSVAATPLPENRFLTGTALEFGGTLSYAVLYIGEGGELFEAPLTTEYTASAAIGENGVTDAAAVGIDTAVENVTCRVTAPRKLTLKSRMKTKLTATAPRVLSEEITESAGARLTPADEIAIERLKDETDDTCLARGELTATTEGTISAQGKVIRCRGAVRVEEAVASLGAVTVRGDVIVTVITLSPEGTYVSASAKEPFTETITVPGAEAGDAARASGRAASVTVTMGEDGARFEIEYDLEAEVARFGKCVYTADTYSTDCRAAATFAEADSLALVKCGQGSLTVSGEGERRSKPISGETVLDTYAVPSIEGVALQNGRLMLTGNCAVTVLLLSDGDVVAEELVLPWRYECDAAVTDGADLLWRCAAESVGASARPEGDKLSARLDLALSMTVLRRDKIRCVQTVTLTKSEKREADDGCIRVTYPARGEALWEIAKRYGVSVETVRRQNGIPDTEKECDGVPLLI